MVAPFSQYDLTLLDLLDERLDTDQPPVPVYVANLQDYATSEQLMRGVPWNWGGTADANRSDLRIRLAADCRQREEGERRGCAARRPPR